MTRTRDSSDGNWSGQPAPVAGRVWSVFWPVLSRKVRRSSVSEESSCPRISAAKDLQSSSSLSLLIFVDLILTFMYTIHTVLMYTSVFHVWRDSIWSKFCEFCQSTGQSRTSQQLTIIAGGPAGRTGTLPVRSGNENLDWFHLCATCRQFPYHILNLAWLLSVIPSNGNCTGKSRYGHG